MSLIEFLGNLGFSKKIGAAYFGDVEPSAGVELADWNGFSLDLIGTPTRTGAGISKDLFHSESFELDAGIYVAGKNSDLIDFEFRPEFGFGVNIGF